MPRALMQSGHSGGKPKHVDGRAGWAHTSRESGLGGGRLTSPPRCWRRSSWKRSSSACRSTTPGAEAAAAAVGDLQGQALEGAHQHISQRPRERGWNKGGQPIKAGFRQAPQWGKWAGLGC